MSRLFGRAPLHIQEGVASEWEPWFAWYPVKTEQGPWIWLCRTYRRFFYPPAWFIPPAPWRWREYSCVQKSFWEVP